MIQLDTADLRSATCLPSLDSGSSEPSVHPTTPADSRPGDWSADSGSVEFLPYVSPPPMPWPRVFPSL